MSRRPRLSDEDATYRAQHALVPQAKMWSESPTPRVGPARPLRQLADQPEVILYAQPQYVGCTVGLSGTGGLFQRDFPNVLTTQVYAGDWAGYSSPVWSETHSNVNVTPADGDGILVITFAINGCIISEPFQAGWALLGSGTSGGITWKVWWGVKGVVTAGGFRRNTDYTPYSTLNPGYQFNHTLFRPDEIGGILPVPYVQSTSSTGASFTLGSAVLGLSRQMTYLVGRSEYTSNTWAYDPLDPIRDYYVKPVYERTPGQLGVLMQYGAGYPLAVNEPAALESYYPTAPYDPNPDATWTRLVIGFET